MGVDLNTQSKYAILAMAYLATQRPGRLVPIREIGNSLDAPRLFLAKILAELSRNGLVISRRGPGGGVRLSRPPSEVRLADIVNVLQPTQEGHECFLGFPRCDGENPCPLHTTWSRIRGELDSAMGDRTLADLGTRV